MLNAFLELHSFFLPQVVCNVATGPKPSAKAVQINMLDEGFDGERAPMKLVELFKAA